MNHSEPSPPCLSTAARRADSRRTLRTPALIVIAAAVVTAAASPAVAAQARTVWDGVYTQEQAARGASSFEASCARCHAVGFNTGEEGRSLVGDPFWQSFRESTVDYLFNYISGSMPNGAGGSLSTNTYLDLVTFILSRNGLPAGAEELTEDSAVGVQIIAETGPGELPDGTLVHVVGCLARGDGGGWALTRAAAPQRAQTSETVDTDAERALGTGTFALKFVLTSLEPYLGHRMRVRGLLMGDGGLDGINVSTTDSLGESCE